MSHVSKNWPSAPATIEQGYIERKLRGEVGVIAYSYSVEGNYYAGSSKQSFMLEGAQQFIDRYPANTKVFIRYHPGDPTRSVLRDQDQAGPQQASPSR